MKKANNFDLGGIIGGLTGGTTGGTTGTTSGITSTTGGTASPYKLSVDATVQGMQNFASILPEGGLKEFFSDPIGSIKTMIFGRVYQTGQYRLGERFIRHIMNKPIGGYREVPDEIVPVAQKFFTIALGVDVNNDEDLQALDTSVDAYLSRPDKQGIPVAAVHRAVAIKKYWPMSVNGQWFTPWPLDVIYQLKSDPLTMGYDSRLINMKMPVELKAEGDGQSNLDTGGVLGALPGGGKAWLFIGLAILAVLAVVYFARKK